MKVAFKTSFVRDLKKIRDEKLLAQIRDTIDRTEKSNDLAGISNIKQLKGLGNHFRIRIGTYRIGLALVADTLYFVRCLPRKDIYKRFP